MEEEEIEFMRCLVGKEAEITKASLDHLKTKYEIEKIKTEDDKAKNEYLMQVVNSFLPLISMSFGMGGHSTKVKQSSVLLDLDVDEVIFLASKSSSEDLKKLIDGLQNISNQRQQPPKDNP